MARRRDAAMIRRAQAEKRRAEEEEARKKAEALAQAVVTRRENERQLALKREAAQRERERDIELAAEYQRRLDAEQRAREERLASLYARGQRLTALGAQTTDAEAENERKLEAKLLEHQRRVRVAL